jgi:hypothetical protein
MFMKGFCKLIIDTADSGKKDFSLLKNAQKNSMFGSIKSIYINVEMVL